MNDKRRKMISNGRSLIEEGKGLIDTALEEEQDAYNNLPEGVQDSDRGCEMEENIDSLQSASDSLGDALDYIDEIS